MFHTPTVAAGIGTRIRAEFSGRTIADSTQALILRESPFKIFYLFPENDLDRTLIDMTTAKTSSRKLGKFVSWAVRWNDRTADNAAFAYVQPAEGAINLREYIGLHFEAMDRWYEEDEELIGHPRDPYTRIDVRGSSRHVVVRIDGVSVADSHAPLVLTETGLALRYYLPVQDVDWNYFTATDTTSVCPYKGVAHYWSATVNGNVYQDVIWKYPEPLQDAERVRDTVGIYHERIELYVDEKRIEVVPDYFTK